MDEAAHFSLFMMRAALGGRGKELVDIAKGKLSR